MICEVWYCVTNETLTLIAFAEGVIIACAIVWLIVLDGIVSAQDRYIKGIRDQRSLRGHVKAGRDQVVRDAQAQEQYGIDYGE